MGESVQQEDTTVKQEPPTQKANTHKTEGKHFLTVRGCPCGLWGFPSCARGHPCGLWGFSSCARA